MNIFWDGFEKQAKRTMMSDLTSSLAPTLVVIFNPQDQRAKIFIQRLDKSLQDMSGLDRLRIIALNQMTDRDLVGRVGASDKEASIVLMKQGKVIGSLDHTATSMEITEFINSHRKDLM